MCDLHFEFLIVVLEIVCQDGMSCFLGCECEEYEVIFRICFNQCDEFMFIARILASLTIA